MATGSEIKKDIVEKFSEKITERGLSLRAVAKETRICYQSVINSVNQKQKPRDITVSKMVLFLLKK